MVEFVTANKRVRTEPDVWNQKVRWMKALGKRDRESECVESCLLSFAEGHGVLLPLRSQSYFLGVFLKYRFGLPHSALLKYRHKILPLMRYWIYWLVLDLAVQKHANASR